MSMIFIVAFLFVSVFYLNLSVIYDANYAN